MANRAVAVVLLHCSGKFDGAFNSGCKATRISAPECLVDLTSAEDNKGWHAEREEISFIQINICSSRKSESGRVRPSFGRRKLKKAYAVPPYC